MKKESILESDLLDIVFDNRNKAYGAYTLRKDYGKRLFKAGSIMGTVVIVFSAFTFLPDRHLVKKGDMITTTGVVQLAPKEQKKPEPPAAKLPATTTASHPPSLIRIVNADVVKPIVADTSGRAVPVLQGLAGPVTGDPGPVATGIPTAPVNPDPLPLAPVKPAIYDADAVDVPPSFPGGLDALRKFLKRNLVNPHEMEDGESVSVKVKFVVGYDGHLQSFVTVQDGGADFNNEVIRVLKKMPDWTPGKANGESVPVYITIPIKFVPAE